MDIETIEMTIIANSGEARGLAFQALEMARKGDFKESNRLMHLSKESSVKAHQAQTDILVAEAGGNTIGINVLLIHSQDHLMTSMLAQDLIKEMIKMYEERNLEEETE